MNTSQIIDRSARNDASALIHRFMSGEIMRQDVFKNWPKTGDLALKALHVKFQRTFAFGNQTKDSEIIEAGSKEYDTISRYALFCKTELPYEWPLEDIDNINGLPNYVKISYYVIIALLFLYYIQGTPLYLILIALFYAIDQIQSIRNELKIIRHGDVTVWPFISQSGLKATNNNKDGQ